MKQLRSGFIALLVCSFASISFAQSADVPHKPDSSIPYSTLEEAIKALREKSGVTFQNKGGWMVAEDLADSTVWLFTPFGHPAYPSMVRRSLVNTSGHTYMDTNVLCLAEKEICDKYFGSK